MKDQIKIIVVDDSVQARRQLEKILASQGYSVVLLENGKTLSTVVNLEKPDLILLDIVMPEIDGFKVMQNITRDCDMFNIPVIFLTGNDDSDSKIRAFDLGAVDYIVKPFNPAEVRARVKVHLRSAFQLNTIIREQASRLRQITEARDSILVKPADLPEAKFSVLHSAVLEAGGDFYDVIKISDSRYVYFVADLSGHDIGTSFMVPALKALIRQNSQPVYSIEETLSMMNSVLLEILDDEKYLTAFYLVVDRELGTISWSGAAHPPAIFIPSEGEPSLLAGSGDLIGMFKNAKYPHSEMKVKKGDRVVIITDGLLEGANPSVWTNNPKFILQHFSSVSKDALNDIPERIFEMYIPKGVKVKDDVIVLVTEI